ncbi:trypsin-like serine protease [Enterococcus sp. CSURQ0835]|uniref:trypsin-like serine protease n=1 Tax=Enterococcus sp. CSURQ0835 TaxID=2681394 RepID=UPI00135A8707|nr:trypsin-like serine protease [Enterococcus sp. CSURQ0835]
MTNNLKKAFLSIFVMIMTSLGIGSVISDAASPYDMVTDDGQVITADKKSVDTPSQQGYQTTNNSKTGLSGVTESTKNSDSLQGEFEPNKVIGPDNRREITNTSTFPYSSIVQINSFFSNNSSAGGTGVLIAPDTVLTAAHVVYDIENQAKWATNVDVYPGRNKSVAPFGEASKVRLAVSSGFTTAKKYDEGLPYDIAMIRLNKPIGLQSGWMGLSSNLTPQTAINITGYPGDKYTSDRQPTMWTDSGKITGFANNNKNINYQIDAVKGQSGSPVYNNQNQVVTIHTFESISKPYNGGTYISSAIQGWINEELNNTQSIYRMYNKNTGEHFYTNKSAEVDLLQKSGWNSEGLAWFAPSKGNPVYRVFNPNNGGDHHYTLNANERDMLIRSGWKDEGIAFYSDPSQKTPLYRLYNPSAKSGAHHYTVNTYERDALVKSGWKYEGIAWYGL